VGSHNLIEGPRDRLPKRFSPSERLPLLILCLYSSAMGTVSRSVTYTGQRSSRGIWSFRVHQFRCNKSLALSVKRQSFKNILELWLYELLGGGGDATYVLLGTCFPFPEADHVLLAHSYPVQSRWASIINTAQSQLLYFVSEDALRCGVLIMVPPFRKEFVRRSLEQEHCQFLKVPTLSSFMEYVTRCDYSG